MQTIYRRNPKVEEAPLQGDLMLFDPEKSQFFVLNRTMAYLWRNCDGQRPFTGIVESVREDFAGADEMPVETEMHQALSELLELGLVTSA